MRYTISVKTLQGKILTFSTESYEVLDGFVCWLDVRTGEPKKFHSSNCEIYEDGDQRMTIKYYCKVCGKFVEDSEIILKNEMLCDDCEIDGGD